MLQIYLDRDRKNSLLVDTYILLEQYVYILELLYVLASVHPYYTPTLG